MKRMVIAVAAFVATWPCMAADAKKPEGSVSVRARAKQPDADGKQVIELVMTIAPGWHVYANPVGNDKFEAIKTRVTFVGANRPKVIGIDYPPGKAMEEDGDKFQSFEGEVPIRATVERSGGQALEIEVRFTACNATSCRPSIIKLTVP